MDRLRAHIAAHWPYAATGGVTGGVVAWIVMIAAQSSQKGLELIVNSDVIGAAIGAFLAISGAYGLERWRRMSAVRTAKNIARDTAGELFTVIEKYGLRMGAYENGVDAVDQYRVITRTRVVLQEIERAAITFDMAANFAIGDPATMVPIAYLSKSVKACAEGLPDILNITPVNNLSKNMEMVEINRRGADKRLWVLADLRAYAKDMKLALPQTHV